MTDSESLSLATPDTFPAFPYALPYKIQLDLMQHLYASIEHKKITIVESPTGTGKTLSLLCASLTWLSDDRQRSRKGQLDALSASMSDSKSKEPDWVIQQSLQRLKEDLLAEERELSDRLNRARKKEQQLRQSKARVTKRPRLSESTTRGNLESFLPESQVDENVSANLPQSVQDLLRRYVKQVRDSPLTTRTKRDVSVSDGGNSPLDSVDVEMPKIKILYVSRTHSQLSQLVGELLKVKYTNPELARPPDNVKSEEPDAYGGSAHPRFVVLASRSNLCINDQVRRRSGDLDENCREVLNGEGCSYLPKTNQESQLNDLRDSILASPKDLEDLVRTGKSMHTCPYFATRKSICLAEVVAMPYSLLLQKGARESLGLNVDDKVVVIDEAHNLIDAILQLQSTEISARTIKQSLLQLREYLRRFRTRLNPSNSQSIERLVTFLTTLLGYTQQWTTANSTQLQSGEVIDVNELMNRLGGKVAGMNLSSLLTFMRSNKIARKVSGYCTYAAEDGASNDTFVSGTPLFAVESLIQCVTQSAEDGRIAIRKVDGTLYLKYQQLNPASSFGDIVSSARCVVLAGGTMSPFADITSQLLPNVDRARITTFTCGHVIPQQNLQCVVIGKGPSGKDIVLKHAQRSEKDMITEVGQVILNIARMVPRGLVVFVPSYSFLEAVKDIWQECGILTRLQKQKQVFYEPRNSSEVDETLLGYRNAVYEGGNRGALLFAVVGAKLSEGLNFSDDLARCVVILGLPFANLHSAELKERMRYVDGLAKTRSTFAGKSASAELYENLCMRAVNQSIGRAIRHKGDWAALVLVDARYATSSIRGKLPEWINEAVTISEHFGHSIRVLAHFFKSRVNVT